MESVHIGAIVIGWAISGMPMLMPMIHMLTAKMWEDVCTSVDLEQPPE